MRQHKGILLTEDFDLAIRPIKDEQGKIVSGLVVGNTTVQNGIMTLKLHQGNLKADPLIGVGLTKYMRGKLDHSQIAARIRVHFTRAGLDYDDFKTMMK